MNNDPVLMNRPALDLCGTWRAVSEGGISAEPSAFAGPTLDDSNWCQVPVPSTFESVCPGLDHYSGGVWYRRAIAVPAVWQDRHVALCLEGVNDHAKVYVNGTAVGENAIGFLPWELPVHQLLRFGEVNSIAIRVDARSQPGENPGQVIAWRNFGGILRPLRLEARHPTHIAAIRATAQPAPGGGELQVEAELSQAHGGTARLTLLDDEGRVIATRQMRLSGEPSLCVPYFHIDGIRPWSPAKPVLYRLQVHLLDARGPIDSREITIGFRSIQTRDGKLLLNGQPVFLTGFNRHEDSPTTHMASDLRMALQDLRQMKLAGANFVRLCHYPHDPRELDLCDRLGLLVMGEIPLYWLSSEPVEAYRGKVQQATEQLDRMIARDRNHPCVVFWSVSNETHEEQPLVREANEKLLRQARAADPTRLIVHVSDHWRQCPDGFAEDDVVCVNGYPNVWHWGQPPATVEGAADLWRNALARLHAQNPGKPVFVTEFGHPGIAGQSAGPWGTSRQAAAIAAEFAAFDAPWICGVSLWCWADHPWPPGKFLDGMSISPFGAVTRGRVPKPAMAAITQLFRQAQGLPVDRPLTMPDGPCDVTMTCDHALPVPPVPLPDGYRLAPITPATASLWADIWRDADRTIDIPADLFSREFGENWGLIAERCWLVYDTRGRALATISAWLDQGQPGGDIGRIHWVAIRPPWQGVGLARPMMSHAMAILQARHDRSYLVTQAFRIPAIALYLKYGFAPRVQDERSRQLWAYVATRLDHPAIEAALQRQQPHEPSVQETQEP